MAIIVNGKKVAGVGKPGKSAYQAAVEGGYTGTEADFNSSLSKIDDIFSYVPDVSDQISEHNADDSAHPDIRAELSGKEQAGAADAVQSNLDTHTADKQNPHATTAKQVGADPEGSAAQALVDAKSYTDQKISEIPAPDVSGQIAAHNASGEAHQDIRTELAKKETAGAANQALEDAKAYADSDFVKNKQGVVSGLTVGNGMRVSYGDLSLSEGVMIESDSTMVFNSASGIEMWAGDAYPEITLHAGGSMLHLQDGFVEFAGYFHFWNDYGVFLSNEEGISILGLIEPKEPSSPTTKNYVDTAIATAIGAALEASY